MKVIYGIGRIARPFPKAVAAIGVFDAIHRGHQKVIAQAVSEAQRIGGTSIVITFFPHPVSILRPREFLGYVLSLPHRIQLIKECGADVCLVIPFTKQFARMSASDFVQRVLVKKLSLKKVVVGEDFHFGAHAKGSVDILSKISNISGEKVKLNQLNNINIKTKFIKSLIKEGNLKLLKKFLGRDYSLLSDVEAGDARGRRLGFPTANLTRENVIILPRGIYCVRAFFNKREHSGVFYIGTRPTFKKPRGQDVLELHVLDYKGNLYGKKILVKFLKKIRDDRKFPDEKELVGQIRRDVLAARKFFSRNTSV